MKKECNVEIPRLTSQSMARLKWFKAQVVELCFIFNLEYRYTVLSREMQHWLFDSVKSAHRSPKWGSWEKPLRTNLEILEWSSLDVMDQVGSSKQGFGVLWPEQRLVFSRTGLIGLVWQSQQLVFELWVFIPLGPLLRGLLVSCIFLSFLRHFLDQLALPNTLYELC